MYYAFILLIKRLDVKYIKKTHKFGLPLCKSMVNALAIDHKIDSTLWANEFDKEMHNVCVAYDAPKDCRSFPYGFQLVKYHMIFDIKMEEFHCKALLVVGSI